ncbi:MAG: ribosome silencing factor [Chlamydiales bacterium]|nr:ribosome silencing factor [Chlamydiales bacterium]
MKNDSLQVLNAIAQAIYDKKGVNILALDLRKFSTITDFVIIAEGNVDRHVIAIAQCVRDELRKMGELTAHTEGMDSGDWVVLDYVQVMVHLFMPGMRDKYHLEDLWKEGEIVDLTINVSSYNTTT